jgi:hypothetical protein
MKAWSAALRAELSAWPDVNSRPMFGLTALYRKKRIFAVLPQTRGMESPNSVAFRLANPSPRMLARVRKEPRILKPITETQRWFSFEFSSDLDLRDALGWLTRAYEAAR